MGRKSPPLAPNWQPPTPEEREQMRANTARSPYAKLLRQKPWEKAGMDFETYGSLLAFCAAHPQIVLKLLLKAGEAIEQQREQNTAPDALQ